MRSEIFVNKPDYGMQQTRGCAGHCRLRHSRSGTYLSLKHVSSKTSKHVQKPGHAQE